MHPGRANRRPAGNSYGDKAVAAFPVKGGKTGKKTKDKARRKERAIPF
jgi:hypothetical protein